MHILNLALLNILLTGTIEAAGPTSIYIDQIPLYSALPSCAQARMSAIVRAQSYGCGDDMQLTSFSCFCFESSSFFHTFIATAIQQSCLPTPTAPSITTPDPEITSAQDLFSSYCAKTTELNSTNPSTPAPSTSAPTTPTPTLPPSASPSPHPQPNHTAAIVAPIVSIITILCLALSYLVYRRRRRRNHLDTHPATQTHEPQIHEVASSPLPAEAGVESHAKKTDHGGVPQELETGSEKVELGDEGRRAELEAEEVGSREWK